MKESLVFEDIEELRKQQGIIDLALHRDIERLKPGSKVRLSLLIDRHGAETVVVRLTSIRRETLRGRLVQKPKASAFKALLPAGFNIPSISHSFHCRLQQFRHLHGVVEADAVQTRPVACRRVEAEMECERPLGSIRLNRNGRR